jgi:hypothetical protein
MRGRTAAATIGLTVLLLGCADSGGGRSGSAPSTATAPAAAAASAGATTAAAGSRFDGRYRGDSNLTLSRGRACGPQSGMRTVVVRNGEARMLYDTMRNVSAVGMVQPDGSVTMLGESDINSRVTGRFEGGRFRGELATVQCVRALDLPRVGR